MENASELMLELRPTCCCCGSSDTLSCAASGAKTHRDAVGKRRHFHWELLQRWGKAGRAQGMGQSRADTSGKAIPASGSEAQGTSRCNEPDFTVRTEPSAAGEGLAAGGQR